MSAPGREREAVDSRGPAYRWVYLWHWPIRAMHWVAAASITVLIATGFFIGRPYFVGNPADTSQLFVMGTMRFIHFAAAGALVATAIIRIYWLFAGNRYERAQALLPIDRKSLWNGLRMMRKYLLFRRDEGPHYVGHNPMQQLAYTGFYGVLILQIVTGFALYGLADPEGFFYRVFGWETRYFGGVPVVRFVHHALTWIVISFIPVHVYLGVRTDFTDRDGTITSIISGGRWVRDDVHYEDA
jgi:Ni/Fe-hydrogenase 1 B-type cytochrome subunit